MAISNFVPEIFYLDSNGMAISTPVGNDSNMYLGYMCAGVFYVRVRISRSLMTTNFYNLDVAKHGRSWDQAKIMPLDNERISLFMLYLDVLNHKNGILQKDFTFEFEVDTNGKYATSLSNTLSLEEGNRAGKGLLNVFIRNQLTPITALHASHNSILGRFLDTNALSQERYLHFRIVYAKLPTIIEGTCYNKEVLAGKLRKIDDPAHLIHAFSYPFGDVYTNTELPTLTLMDEGFNKASEMLISKGMLQTDKEIFISTSLTNSHHMNLYRSGREISQNTLMGNCSANDLGKIIFQPLDGKNVLLVGGQISYEWLHLIAHRFGIGTDNETTTSSQVNTNLVFGTDAANTQMILLEDAIQHYIYDKKRSAHITVQTTIADMAENKVQCLVENINYAVTYLYENPQSKISTTIYSQNMIFCPTSTYYPSIEEYYIFQELTRHDIQQQLLQLFPEEEEEEEEADSEDGFNPDDFFTEDTTIKFQASHLSSPIFALKLSDISLCDVVNNEFVPKPKTRAATTLKANDEEKAYTAKAKVFDQEEIPTKMALLPGGHSVASMELPGEITLDQIFSSFTCGNTSSFSFGKVKINYIDHKLLFEGELSLEKKPLVYFKEFLPDNFSLFIRSEIFLNSFDLTKKIQPTYAKFTTAAQFTRPLGKLMTLREAELSVLCEPVIDMVKKEKRWNLRPIINARLSISHLSTEDINLSCTISYVNSQFNIIAQCNAAHGLLNIPGLTLQDLVVEGEVGRNNQLSVKTALDINTRLIAFSGKLGDKGFGIASQLANFNIHDLFYLYFEIFHETIELPDYEMTFEDVTLSLATEDMTVNGKHLDKGLHLSCQLKVHGTSYYGNIQLSDEGIRIEGGCKELMLSDLKIKEAGVRIAIARKGTQQKNDFFVTGTTEIKGITTQCKMECKKIDNKWVFYLYARVQAESFSLVHIFPEAQNTLLDEVKFKELTFVYANQDLRLESGNIAQGLTLQGQLKEITALSNLGISTQDLGFLLHFGNQCNFQIENKGEALSLGESITCDPYRIQIQITPVPTLELLFGFHIYLPEQSQPLQFIIALSIGRENAYGYATMTGWWENPFGIARLRIGPQVVLELNIDYKRFMATRLPSSMGIAGGLQLGEETMQMAVKIEQEARKDILEGSVTRLTVQDLLSLTETLTHLKFPSNAIPDFFEIHDFYLYIAPSGGRIGTMIYEKGVSFHAILVLFQKKAEITAAFNNTGFIAKGKMDALKLGPLEIRGKQKEELSFDMEFTSQTQHFMFDGLISLFGMEIAAFVKLSKEAMILECSMNFLNLFLFEVKGKSVGDLHDFANLDIQIEADMQNNISEYIKTEVVGKIKIAIENIDTKIKEAEKKVKETQEVYHALYNPAFDQLNKAQREADLYFDRCVNALKATRKEYEEQIEKAKKEIEYAKKAFDNALDKACREVKKAEGEYRKEIDSAQREVCRAEREYENALNSAVNEVNRAEQVYINSFESAKNDVRNAQREVDKIQREADRDIYELKHLAWYEYLYKAPYLSAKIAGEEVAYGIATGVLEVAKGILDGVRYSTQYVAFETSKATLEVVHHGVKYIAFESSKQTLQYIVKEGVTFLAFKNTELLLEGIKEGSEYVVWQNAIRALDIARVAGSEAIGIAQVVVDTVGRSIPYVLLEEAKAALELIRTSTEFIAFGTAQVALEGARLSSKGVLTITAFALEHAGDILDIKHIHLEASLKGVEKGKIFKATINVTFIGIERQLVIDFDVNNIFKFIDDLFLQLITIKA